MKRKIFKVKLSDEAKDWHDRLKEEYSIDDDAGLLLLQTVAESFDLMRSAQKEIESKGLMVKDRFSQDKINPATVTLRDAKSSMLLALKQLNLDLEPLNDGPGRPPGR